MFGKFIKFYFITFISEMNSLFGPAQIPLPFSNAVLAFSTVDWKLFLVILSGLESKMEIYHPRMK